MARAKAKRSIISHSVKGRKESSPVKEWKSGEEMKLEYIQKAINALKKQKEKPFAVIMSPKNLDALVNTIKQDRLIVQGIPNKAPPSIGKEELILFGMLIKAHRYLPEDSFYCVTKDGYDKLTAKPKMEDLIIFPTKLFEEKVVDCNVIPDKKKVLEWYEKLEELLKKEITMQEIKHDDTLGKIFVESTIKDLIPHIKKSLAKPDVKYVKVYADGIGPEKCRAEEEKKNFFEQTFKEPVEEVEPE